VNESEKRKLITKIAKLYYYGNMKQADIAKMMGISRPKVSRLLSQASQFNIVRIEIKDNSFYDTDIAEKLRDHFGLQYVKVVPSGQIIEESKDNIGIAASEYLNEHVFDGIHIGIAWGTTVNAFINRFHTSKVYPRSKVLQLTGGTYSQSLHMDGRELTKTLAQKLGGGFSVIQAPLIVHNPDLKRLMLQEPETKEHFRLMEKLNIAFIGIGSSNYKKSIIYRAKYVSAATAKKMYDSGLCDICGHQIDINGKEPYPQLSECHIGISLQELTKVPLVIGLCTGKDKLRSIISAIHGRYISGLIIDEVAAISLMEDENLS